MTTGTNFTTGRTLRRLETTLLLLGALLAGCRGGAAVSAPGDEALLAVASVHGGAGPWAVAGYRMGVFALRHLGLRRGSFDLEVTHFTPQQVQYACVADGAAAATGASLGKLNLALAPAAPEEVRTRYRRRSTQGEVTLRVTPGFAARFLNVPHAQLPAAGRATLALRDEEIFTAVP